MFCVLCVLDFGGVGGGGMDIHVHNKHDRPTVGRIETHIQYNHTHPPNLPPQKRLVASLGCSPHRESPPRARPGADPGGPPSRPVPVLATPAPAGRCRPRPVWRLDGYGGVG